ncbi:hypothetical protein B0H13DRAFT_1904640 [Mycena leptocephala]|nr:hypothetical protein B0H13DRAFT_1904640 [Mycena leptocephala]
MRTLFRALPLLRGTKCRNFEQMKFQAPSILGEIGCPVRGKHSVADDCRSLNRAFLPTTISGSLVLPSSLHFSPVLYPHPALAAQRAMGLSVAGTGQKKQQKARRWWKYQRKEKVQVLGIIVSAPPELLPAASLVSVAYHFQGTENPHFTAEWSTVPRPQSLGTKIYWIPHNDIGAQIALRKSRGYVDLAPEKIGWMTNSGGQSKGRVIGIYRMRGSIRKTAKNNQNRAFNKMRKFRGRRARNNDAVMGHAGRSAEGREGFVRGRGDAGVESDDG